MRFLALLTALILTSCRAEPEVVAPPPVPTPAPLVFETHYRSEFSDDVQRRGWTEVVEAHLETISQTSPPDEFWEVVPEFHPTIETMIGDTSVWNSTSRHHEFEFGFELGVHNLELPERPTEGTARLLEDEGNEFAAAQIWISLGNSEEALRLARLNLLEGEEGAAAQVAIWLGDQVLFVEALRQMYDNDEITRTKGFVERAVNAGEMGLFWAALSEFSWHPFEHLDLDYTLSSIALQGDEKLLVDFIEADLARWELCSADGLCHASYTLEDRTVLFIVALDKLSHEKALEYARRYLNSPNPLLFIYDGGYESSERRSTRGAFELYNIVKSDADLSDLHISLVRGEFNARFALHTEGEMVHPDASTSFRGMKREWESDVYVPFSVDATNLLYAHMYQSRHDPALKQMWVELLDGLDLLCYGDLSVGSSGAHRRPVFVQQFGRAALGLPFDPDHPGLSSMEAIPLQRLRGDVDTAVVRDLWGERYASVSGSRHYMLDFVFSLLVSGPGAPGFEARLLGELTGEDEDVRSLREELGYAYVQGTKQWFDPRSELLSHLLVPFRVAAHNHGAHVERDEKGVQRTGGHLDTADEVWGMLLPVLPEVRELAPHVYEALVLQHPIPEWYTLPEVGASEVEDMSSSSDAPE
ncbi:MAG: hypothetical protein P8J32_05680 [bacterium]|nr:hypothetical protein [bacterium]